MRGKALEFLLQKDSKITSVKDLKVKKIAVAKGRKVAHLILLYRAFRKKVSCEEM